MLMISHWFVIKWLTMRMNYTHHQTMRVNIKKKIRIKISQKTITYKKLKFVTFSFCPTTTLLLRQNVIN